MRTKKISIVAPLYNEFGNAYTLAEELFQTLQSFPASWEVILVNDGSEDLTWTEIQLICKNFPNFKGIDLGGNYGQSFALRSGYEQSTGEIIIFMDGDLQHDPADIPRFLDKIYEGFDMVGGAKIERPEGFLQKNMSRLAHWMICKISGVKMSYFGGTYRAYRRFLLENSNILKDSHRFLGAVIARKGVKHTEIPIKIRQRGTGKSNYKLLKMLPVIIDLIFLKFSISYMAKPFRLFGLVGGLMLVGGLIPLTYLILGSVFFGKSIQENNTIEFLFSGFLCLMGLIMISFGFVAEIGIYNYYSNTQIKPYSIRQMTQSTAKINEKTLNR